MRRLLIVLAALAAPASAQDPPGALFHDSHFHLTNYVQDGPSAARFLEIMGDRVGRSTLFGIPLQQTWNPFNSGEDAPTYYLHSDSPLYYYSFTDAWIAMQYRSLAPEQQARFDPMITGFNPSDMYAADHIRRVLTTFPGVFSGIGEFTIHKEFVSSKVAGDTATLLNPALDRILSFCEETGLLVILHNDIDVPFGTKGEPAYLTQIKEVLRRHPKAKIIWAHVGLGRVVPPAQHQASGGPGEHNPNQREIVEAILKDRSLRHVYFDISWDVVARVLMSTPESARATAEVIDAFPERFLFGTDNVAPPDQETHLATYRLYEPLWAALTPEASRLVRIGNYERLFDEAATKVRAWEAANVRTGGG